MSTAVPSGVVPNAAFVTAPCAAIAVVMLSSITFSHLFVMFPRSPRLRRSTLRYVSWRIAHHSPTLATILQRSRRHETAVRWSVKSIEPRTVMTPQTRTLPLLTLVLFCLCLLNENTAAAAPPDHWVGTWATSPVALPNPDGKLGAEDTTYREIVHVSLAGSAVRIILSNEFGLDPLTIAAAHIALRGTGSEIALTSANSLTFRRRPSVTIPPGAMLVSDPANLKLPAFGDLAVSLFVPAQPMHQVSHHACADQTTYVAAR